MSEKYIKRTKKGKGRKRKRLTKDIDKMISETSPLVQGFLTSILLSELEKKEENKKLKEKRGEKFEN